MENKGLQAALLLNDQKETEREKKILYKYIMVQEKVERCWATERNQRVERDEEKIKKNKK